MTGIVEFKMAGVLSWRSAIIYLLISLIGGYVANHTRKSSVKYNCLNVQILMAAKNASSVYIVSNAPQWKKPAKSKGHDITLSTKLVNATRLLNFTLAASLVLLSNDVHLNPGPASPQTNSLASSRDASSTSCSPASINGGPLDDSLCSERSCDNHPYFDLGLDNKGLRIGHWNVNRLTAKFDQIKLFLTGKFGRPQVDLMFLNETFLKHDIPDSLYAVPGFSIYRRDRSSKAGGGVMAFVNDELTVKRRTDLETAELEIIWLEVFPFKSKRSLLLSGIYRPPSYSKADDIKLEANIEKAYLVH